jgi:hypothetical protein
LVQKGNKKWVSLLHRAATTKYPCCDQALGGSLGAGRVGLTQAQRYINFIQIQKREKIISCRLIDNLFIN